MVPLIDSNGRIIQDEATGNIDFRSDGDAGFLLSIAKSGVINMWDGLGVQYINVFGIRDALVRIGDPLSLGYLIDNSLDVLLNVVSVHSPLYPYLIQHSKNEYRFCNPKRFPLTSPIYSIPSPFYLINYNCLKKALSSSTYKLVKYQRKRAHEEIKGEIGFELNLLSIFGVTNRKKLSIRVQEDYIVFKNCSKKEFSQQLLNISKDWAESVLSISADQFDNKEIMRVFIEFFYTGQSGIEWLERFRNQQKLIDRSSQKGFLTLK